MGFAGEGIDGLEILFWEIFMKKIAILLLGLMLIVSVAACAKKEITYSGSVMIYSSLNREQMNALKKAVEEKFNGITLDYYFGEVERIERKLYAEKDSGQVNADVLMFGGKDNFNELKDKNILKQYESKETKQIESDKRDKDGKYYIVDFDGGISLPIGLVDECINEENAKLLIDFLLSKDAKAIFTGE